MNLAPSHGGLASTPDTGGDARVLLGHGGGGTLTDDLLAQVVFPRLNNEVLQSLLDASVLPALGPGRCALTIDGYVVQPWRFPGGDIGRLAVCGTVNDLAMVGATHGFLALSLLIEEGFRRDDLAGIMDSIQQAAAEAGVQVVTGDTKVVGRGHADSIYITTAGVGVVPPGRDLSPGRVQPGDAVLVSGTIGDHGLAVMLARDLPQAETTLASDAAPLNGLVESLLSDLGSAVKFLRDPTRAGLAGVAADLGQRTGLHVRLEERAIPVRGEARHAADLLGLDVLELANEGKLVAVVDGAAAPRALKRMRSHALGRDAAVVGSIEAGRDGVCEIHTAVGGRRVVQKPYGEQLARIC